MWNFFQWTIFRKTIIIRILDNAWELYFLIIWMQKLNNFFRQRMGKILSKTRSNWLSGLAWNFVMIHKLWLVFCGKHTRYFINTWYIPNIIFAIQVRVIFATYRFNSICCIFCDLNSCHWMATSWSLLSDFTSTSFKIVTLCVCQNLISKPMPQLWFSIKRKFVWQISFL